MQDPESPDVFADAEPIPGIEHLGRAITDAAGMPSGSPANYEHLRGATAEPLNPRAYADAVAALASAFPAPEEP